MSWADGGSGNRHGHGHGHGDKSQSQGNKGNGGEVEGIMGRSSSWGRITEASELGGPQSSLPNLGSVDIWSWVILVLGIVLGMIGCFTASMASTPSVPIAPPVVTTRMSPDIVKCPLVGGLPQLQTTALEPLQTNALVLICENGDLERGCAFFKVMLMACLSCYSP